MGEIKKSKKITKKDIVNVKKEEIKKSNKIKIAKKDFANIKKEEIKKPDKIKITKKDIANVKKEEIKISAKTKITKGDIANLKKEEIKVSSKNKIKEAIEVPNLITKLPKEKSRPSIGNKSTKKDNASKRGTKLPTLEIKVSNEIKMQ